MRGSWVEEHCFAKGDDCPVVIALVAEGPSLDDVALDEHRMSGRRSLRKRCGFRVLTDVQGLSCFDEVFTRRRRLRGGK